ncbi:hypothetical protein L7F22_018280 [Adiantum nelumboides]|nr:hypothetical protein [Adiantum nelumboides]
MSTDKKLKGVSLPQNDEMQRFLSNFKPTPSPSPSPSPSPPSRRSFQLASTLNKAQPCLPCDLQELILARLPAVKLMELEATCPSLWKPLLHCSTFIETWMHLRQGGARANRETVVVWIMRITSKYGQTLVAYIPAQRKYYLLLPMLFSAYVSPSLPVDVSSCEMKTSLKHSAFVSADGPLIAFENHRSSSGMEMIVYNSCTGQMTVLPPLHLEPYSLETSSAPIIISDNDNHSFWMIMQAVELNVPCATPWHSPPAAPVSKVIFVYDSASADWVCYSTSFAHTLCDLEFDAVRYGDLFIYSHWSHELYVWYRGHHGWSKLSIITDTTQPSNCHMEGKVVKCGEHVLLVTLTIHNEEKGFNIWKLTLDNDRLIFKWERVSTTPADLMWKSFGYLHPTYIVDDSNICIMPSSASEYMPPLVYNSVDNNWYNLPGLLKNVDALCAMKLTLTVAEY